MQNLKAEIQRLTTRLFFGVSDPDSASAVKCGEATLLQVNK